MSSLWKKRISVAFAVYSVVLIGAMAVFVITFDGGIPAGDSPAYDPWLSVISFSSLAAFLAYRRPDHRISWLLVITAFMQQLRMPSLVAEMVLANGTAPSVWLLFWSNFFTLSSGPGYALIGFLFVLFPDGRFPTPRFRLAAWFLGFMALDAAGLILYLTVDAAKLLAEAGAAGVDVVLAPAATQFVLESVLHPRPTPEMALAANLLIPSSFSIIITGLVSQIYRFRRGSNLERQQIKWVILVMAAWATGLIPFFLVPAARSAVLLVLTPLIPSGIVVPILRYRLYDIDLIIRRTLVFTVLTGLLAMVYFATVTFMQWVVTSLVGAESPAVIVVATLLSAALFSPLRHRVQTIIDRRFYRAKYDTVQTLAAFAQAARDETDLDALTAELVTVVQTTMQPESVSLWLKER